jgi:hypothetical protein
MEEMRETVGGAEVELDLGQLAQVAIGAVDHSALQMVAVQLKSEAEDVVGYHHSTSHSSYSTHGTALW